YYNVTKRTDGRLQINQLQYGLFSGDGTNEKEYIFKFILEEDEQGELQINHLREIDPETFSVQQFWKRLKGK
ncbi:MAG: hypothetical protein AAF738_01885, partial [Bacteroidota bacterium]